MKPPASLDDEEVIRPRWEIVEGTGDAPPVKIGGFAKEPLSRTVLRWLGVVAAAAFLLYCLFGWGLVAAEVFFGVKLH